MEIEREVVERDDAVGVTLGDVGERGDDGGGRGGGGDGFEECWHGLNPCVESGATAYKIEYGWVVGRKAVRGVSKVG